MSNHAQHDAVRLDFVERNRLIAQADRVARDAGCVRSAYGI